MEDKILIVEGIQYFTKQFNSHFSLGMWVQVRDVNITLKRPNIKAIQRRGHIQNSIEETECFLNIQSTAEDEFLARLQGHHRSPALECICMSSTSPRSLVSGDIVWWTGESLQFVYCRGLE